MASDIICKKCSLSIDQKVERSVFCEGDCSCFYHLACARLSEKEITILSTNYIWLCDECLDRFCRARDSRNIRDGIEPDLSHATASCTGTDEKSMKDELNALKETVAGILKTIARLDGSVGSPLLQSTPVSSSFALQDGTNASSCIVNNDEASTQHSGIDDDLFPLLLTNIDPSVTESDVYQMVMQALGVRNPHLEYVDVVKLVSNQRNFRAIDYVSFKVVLHNSWKAKALDPVTWPKGVRFISF